MAFNKIYFDKTKIQLKSNLLYHTLGSLSEASIIGLRRQSRMFLGLLTFYITPSNATRRRLDWPNAAYYFTAVLPTPIHYLRLIRLPSICPLFFDGTLLQHACRCSSRLADAPSPARAGFGAAGAVAAPLVAGALALAATVGGLSAGAPVAHARGPGITALLVAAAAGVAFAALLAAVVLAVAHHFLREG